MEAGFAPDLFWEVSFREYRAAMRGVVNRLKREHNERAWLAWHVEALSRMKRLPKLKELLHSEKPQRRGMTASEIEGVVRSWLSGNRKR